MWASRTTMNTEKDLLESDMEVSQRKESDTETEIDLFESAMKGRWEEIIEEYKKPHKRKEIITRSEDTVLHLAVLDGQTDIVMQLVATIEEEEESLKILGQKNDSGNTALHLAAKLGDEKMCECLASKQPHLIANQNNESETPLFLSVVQGKKAAFLCLQSLYIKNRKEVDYTICRKENGNTILHCAILGEYFSLAFKILELYPLLASSVNEEGVSPLHVLANKRNTFKSGSLINLFDKIIFRCITVDEDEDDDETENDKTARSKYPDNYTTCMNFFNAIWALLRAFKSSFCRAIKTLFLKLKDAMQKKEKAKDVENPKQKRESVPGDDDIGASAPAVEATNQPKVKNRDKHKRKPAIDVAIHLFPPTYQALVQFLMFVSNALLVILGVGIGRIKKVREKKVQHTWAMKVLNELVQHASDYKYDANGRNPEILRPTSDGHTYDFFSEPSSDDQETSDTHKTTSQEPNTQVAPQTSEKKGPQKLQRKETPILIAAKTGATEIVEKILDTFPVAIQDLDAENKNAVLLSVEHRQTYVYKMLKKRRMLKESVFRQLDRDGNSALHLAAKKGEHIPWLIAGDALQMQWEYKWYKFVKDSMPRHFFVRYNKDGKTPKAIFRETHKDLVRSGSEWLTKTSESCSVVAALNATVAFATSSTVPGGIKEDSGTPTLEDRPAFNVFAISSLVALCFSVTSLVFFLAILTSRYQERDFKQNLPRKLLMGLTTLFASIAAILLSFCAGHFFILTTSLRYVAYPIYAATCLPITFFAFAQLPLYFDLARAIFKKVPEPSYAR